MKFIQGQDRTQIQHLSFNLRFCDATKIMNEIFGKIFYHPSKRLIFGHILFKSNRF